MEADVLTKLRTMIESKGRVEPNEEFRVEEADFIAAPVESSSSCCLQKSTSAELDCIFFRGRANTQCPEYDGGRAICSETSVIFIPKLEYLTWKLTQ